MKRYPLDDTKGLLAEIRPKVNRYITADGNGALEFRVRAPMTIPLFETGDIDIEQARLIYRAKVRTANVEGETYLEMWCIFPDKGEFFSKGLQYSLAGTNDWVDAETPFFLREGENPTNVKLNLVVNGRGIVWIDDIRLVKAPLEEQ